MNKILEKTNLVKSENTYYFEGYRSGSMNGIDTNVSNVIVNAYNFIIDNFDLDDFCDIFNALNFFEEIDDSIEEKVSKMPIKIREAYYLAKHYYDEAKKDGRWFRVDDIYFKEHSFCNIGFNSAGAAFIDSLFNLEKLTEDDNWHNTYNYDCELDDVFLYLDDLEIRVGYDEENNLDIYRVYTLIAVLESDDPRGFYYNFFMVSKPYYNLNYDVIYYHTLGESIRVGVEFEDVGTELVKNIISKTNAEKLKENSYVIWIDGFCYFDWDKSFVKNYNLTEEEFEFLKTNSKFYC